MSEGRAKKQTLAYPINKESTAFFNWIKFSLDSTAIKELNLVLDRHQSVLRFLLIKDTKEEAIKRPVLRPKKLPAVKKEPATEIAKEAEIQIQEEEIDKKIEEILGE